MFNLVKNINTGTGLDSVPVFKTMLPKSKYKIISHLGRATISDDSILVPFTSRYGYKDLYGREYRLSYSTKESSLDHNPDNVRLETIYGSVIPKYLFHVEYISSINKFLIYANESILLLSGCYVIYDSVIGLNTKELCNFETDISGDSLEPMILIDKLPNINLIGDSYIYNEHNLSSSNFLFSDGIKNYMLYNDIPIELINVPIKISKQIIYLPAPYHYDISSPKPINIIYQTRDNNTYSVTIPATHIEYDRYNKLIYVKGILRYIKTNIFGEIISAKASYYSDIKMYDIQLNPLFRSGRINVSTPLRDAPLDLYLANEYTSYSSSPNSTMMFHSELSTSYTTSSPYIDESLRLDLIKAFTIYCETASDVPSLLNIYKEQKIFSKESELDHFVNNMNFDGINHDLSKVGLFEVPYSIYENILNNCKLYSDTPEILADKTIRDIIYRYAPIGRYIVTNFVDSSGNSLKRIM